MRTKLATTLAAAVGLLPNIAKCQLSTFLPPLQGLTTIPSKNYAGASIQYKETTLCETTPGVKSYSGYVNLPPSSNNPYTASIFFWYFESRKDSANAPTTIFLPGGPGASFLGGSSGLPCDVNPDSNSTTLSPWSWNNEVNMLYIDIPVNAGYSYTRPVNGTWDFLAETFSPLSSPTDSVLTNLTSVAVTLSSQDSLDTFNSTAQVARTMWKFSQVWFQEFPEYKTSNDQVNMWTYSYSGFFGPASMAYFAQQNELIANGSSSDLHAKALKLGTLGVENGCIDILAQVASYPNYAINNTYGIQIITEDIYKVAMNNLTKPSGCIDLINNCRAAAAVGDPLGNGNNATVNQLCAAATEMCFSWIQGAYQLTSTKSPFDIAETLPAVFPYEYFIAFYNQRWVQEELGAAVNFTYSTLVVPYNFLFGTGDPMRCTIADLEYMLSAGVGLALVYGDRDYRCNWLGVENVSLVMDYPEATSFRAAGYANISTNNSYIGGLVRQYGNVSFSRVFEAGHEAQSYQPETVYRIFQRAMFGKDVATGQVAAGANYSTVGPSDVFRVKNAVPKADEVPQQMCMLYDMFATCYPDEIGALANGTAVVKDFVVHARTVSSSAAGS